MEASSLALLAVMFVGSGAITWVAGIALTKTTDTLDHRFRIGDAMGGLVLLGITGSLPEIAVVVSAAIHARLDLIIGTLIGGLAMQTLLIVIFDAAASREKPISYLAGTVNLSLETLFAIVITALAVVGIFIPVGRSVFHVSPISAAILVAWLVGLFLINKARLIPRLNQTAEDAAPGRKHHERRKVSNHVFYAKKSTLYVIGVFVAASAATLVAGWLLEESGNAIADKLNIGQALFAGIFIALATSIPEISTGIESVLIGDNHLAISDIMGGNAFMVVLFLLADLVAKKPVLSCAGHTDLAFGVLALAMMAVYMFSFIFRPRKCYLRLGIDSVLQILLYAGGMVILTHIK